MGIFDDLIRVDENGNLRYIGWIEWKHISTGLTHCPVCLVLDKCWFNNNLKPKLPQHENCHCVANNVANPIPMIDAIAKCDIKNLLIIFLVINMLGLVKEIYLKCWDLQ